MKYHHQSLSGKIFYVNSDYSSIYKQRAYRLIDKWQAEDTALAERESDRQRQDLETLFILELTLDN